MVKNYELLYIVPAKYTEDELAPIKEKIKKLLVAAGGEITLEDSLGKKKFAYPIKKIKQGYYLLYEFKLEGAALKKLDNDLRLDDEIIRHLISKKETKSRNMIQITKERTEAAQEKSKQEHDVKEIKEKEKDKDKIKLEDLDKKLDEILDSNIL